MKVLLIRHYGHGFQSNKHAVLIATGKWHHIVLLR